MTGDPRGRRPDSERWGQRARWAAALWLGGALALAAPPARAQAPAPPPPVAPPPAVEAPYPCDGVPIHMLPPTRPYELGQRVPRCYHVARRPRRGFLIAGAALFTVSYGVAVSAAPTDQRLAGLYVPVVGPWVAAETVPLEDPPLGMYPEDLQALGAVEALGAGFFALGFLLQRDILVRDDRGAPPPNGLVSRDAVPSARARRLRAVASPGPSSIRIGLQGSF